MLSKQAFNGLLKTLEEPPSKLKFILATTEVRKIPVTILSRCQRFDLKRVSLDKIFDHLKDILNKEKGKISDDALKLLSRASEGSVRDSISLLDRAIIFQSLNPNQTLEELDVRKMLGLADKSKLIQLLENVFKGEEASALKILREFIEEGLDAKIFLNDILELIYLFSRRVNLGPIEKELFVSESELKLIDKASQGLKIQDLGLFWQLTLKTIEDLNITSNEIITLEMFVIQLAHVKNIDDKFEEDDISNKEVAKAVADEKVSSDNKKNFKPSSILKEQLKNVEQIKTQEKNDLETKIVTSKTTQIKSPKDLIFLVEKNREIELKYDLERNVKIANFEDGKINLNFNENLNKNFIKRLSQCLYSWTGKRWIISLSKDENIKTIYQERIDSKKNFLDKEKKSDISKEILKNFPDANLIDVKKDE